MTKRVMIEMDAGRDAYKRRRGAADTAVLIAVVVLVAVAAAKAAGQEMEAVVETGEGVRAWWTDQQAGYVGGIGGGVLGVLGGVIGTLGGLGKAKRFVMGLLCGLIVVAGCSLVVGLVALGIGQPYAVWYPLTLGGGACCVTCGSVYPGLRERYRSENLR